MRVRKQQPQGPGYITVPTPFVLDEPRLAECPVSYITQESIELIQIAQGLMLAQGAAVNTAKLPGRIVDAMRAIHQELKSVEAAQEEAVHNA